MRVRPRGSAGEVEHWSQRLPMFCTPGPYLVTSCVIGPVDRIPLENAVI